MRSKMEWLDIRNVDLKRLRRDARSVSPAIVDNIMVMDFDCGAKAGVGVRVGKGRHAFRVGPDYTMDWLRSQVEASSKIAAEANGRT